MKKPQLLDKQTNMNFVKVIIVVFCIVKLIHAQLLLNHAYLGADGPNYIKGFLAILDDGVFSEDIHLFYWPAGYSLFIYFCYQVIPSNPLMVLSVIQILVQGISIYVFVKSVSVFKTRATLTFLLTTLLIVSPTLYFMSLSVGYESLISSFYLLVLGLYLRYRTASDHRRVWIAFLIALIMAFIVFIQPRFLVTNLVLILFFQVFKLKFSKVMTIGLILVLLGNVASPALLAARNERVHGAFMISSNFADTLLIGAGDEASGAYNENSKGIDCKLDLSSVRNRESSLTACVLNWYLENPGRGVYLAKNKFLYFWTPWSGPISKGTMANNPWRKIAPADLLEKYLEFSPVRQILVLLSWVYVFGSFLLLAFGAIHSRRSRNTMLQILGLASVVVALANTLISMVTIGDNRFRVPILPFIIILHALGLIGIQSFLKERLIRLKEVPNK